ncbi:MAG TPA: 1,6-anhydro-N-acetylmuramyl-L-alanine amidase AmpD, partial [SAR86 cluster bacterium]|nr:1,6-anhydro-N-acetylmuramyl-L-alanine amidase AmpD [SAR86 cluster bacterium]
MKVNKEHRLEGARICDSPNFSERLNEEISLLVIHNISLPPGQFGNNFVDQFFTNKLDPKKDPYFEEIYEMKVSSHLFIDREGLLTQFVPFDKAAWHAGISEFKGRENCNEFSIGIELEGADDLEYPSNQYKTLIEATKALMDHYPEIKLDNIVG